jgi:glycerol-3-phosphate dehydrogenase (NAD(P)+)
MQAKKVTVLGGGCFGSTIADIIANNKHDVLIWMRDQQLANNINQLHENTKYLPGFKLNENIVATTDIQQAINQADIVFIAIPSKSFRQVIQQTKTFLAGKIIVSTTKGIEPVSFKLMCDIIKEEVANSRVGALSGPNLAKEIIQKKITATVIASDDGELRTTIQKLLHCEYFRVYSNIDRYGVELAGALKNIYAIVSGIGTALNMGENTKSLLITRSLAEMSRFAVKRGANPMTFLGLSGVGDLVATCASKLSRNFQLGFALGQGVELNTAVKKIGQVAEGVNTLEQVKIQADKLNIDMPIAQGLYQIIFHQQSISMMVKEIMSRTHTTDVEFIEH